MNRKPEQTPIPGIGEGKRGEDGHLGYLLRQAGAAHRLRMERALADLEVTPPQFAILTMLAAYPGISGADLARLAMLTPQTVSLIIANLDRGGTIRRRRHEIHGRIQRIDITEAGMDLLSRFRERVEMLERDLLRGFGSAEEKAIRRWLVAVALGDR